MERLEEIKSRVGLAFRGPQEPVTGLSLLTLLGDRQGACQGAAAPNEEPLPAHLWLSPCGGRPQVQWSGSSDWRAVEAPIALESEVRIAVEAADGGRLCAADGSVLELAPGATVDLAPAEDAACREIALQKDSPLFLAVKPAYQFTASGCVLSVTDVPARFTGDLNLETTQLRVEEGRAT